MTAGKDGPTGELFAQMSGLLRSLPLWYYLKDRAGRYIDANELYAQAFGRAPEGLIGRTDDELYPKAAAEAIRATHDRVVETGEPMAIGEETAPIGGQARTMSMWKLPIKDREGTVVAVVGLGLDVAEKGHAEEEQRREEQRFRFVAENATDVIWTMDMDLRITYISPSVRRFRGYAPEEVIGTPPEGNMIPASRELFLAEVEAALASARRDGSDPGGTRTVVLELYHKDGSTVWGEAVFSVMRGDDGGPTGLFGIVRNITERVKAEAAIRESEQRYRLLAENIVDVIWTMGMDFRLSYITPSVERFSGYTQAEVMSMGLEAAFAPVSVEAMRDVVAQELRAEGEGQADPARTRTLELEHIRKDGSIVWAETTISFLRDALGVCIGFQGVTRDITERRRADLALRESEGRLRLLEENVVDVLWTIGTDLRMMSITPSVTRFSGFAPEEVLASSLEEILTPASVEKVIAALEEEFRAEGGGLADPDRTRTMDLEHRRKDGSTVWAETTFSFLRDGSGGLVGFLGVTRDITERRRAQQALRESEERYRMLAENVGDVIWVMDTSMRNTYISPSLQRFAGWTVEELRAGGIQRFLPPESARLARQVIQEEIALERGGGADTKRTRVVEMEFVGKAGHRIHGETTISFLHDAAGNLAGFQGVTRDITERKRAEEALRRSETELRVRNRVSEIFLTAPDDRAFQEVLGYLMEALGCRYGIFGTVGADGCWACPTAQRVASGSKVELDMTLTLHPSAWEDVWGRALREGGPMVSNAPVRAPGGDHTVLRAVAVPLLHRGRVSGAIMLGERDTDFTETEASLLVAVAGKVEPVLHARQEREGLEAERRGAVEALRLSEDRYRDLFENAGDLIQVVDLQGRLLYVNRMWRETLGYAAEECNTLTLADIVHPDHAPIFQSVLERTRDGEQVGHFECVLVTKDGRAVEVEGSMSARIEGGRPVSIRGILHDVTARRRAERESEEARRRAELYVDVLSHDINNMNQAIGAYVEMALSSPGLTKDQRRYLDTTLGQSRAITGLIDNVRRLSALTKGAGGRVTMDLHGVLSDAAQRAIDTHPERVVRVENSRPMLDVTVVGTELLKDVFFNIIDNAIKYDAHGEVVVEVSYTTGPEDGICIVEVADHGPGVPDALKEKIFDRLERGVQRNIGGTGLGLTIANEVVWRAGGAIWVEDRVAGDPGQGARFGVLLPRGAPGAGTDAPREGAIAPGKGG